MLKNDLRIALLIDGDNAQVTLIEPILEKLARHGTCLIKRVYGDFTTPSMSGWRILEQTHAVQLVHQSRYVAGKNTTDIALTIAAMDILHSDTVDKVDAFCIVSSDSDFTPLVTRLKDKGATVIAAGKGTAPQAFRVACSLFIDTDTLKHPPKVVPPKPNATLSNASYPLLPVLPKKAVTKATPPKPNATPSNTKPSSNARPLLQKAYTMTPQKDGWVFIGALGQSLRQIDPQFKSQTYGQKGLALLVSHYRDLFEIRRENGKGGTYQVYVKLKK